jgi:predicted MPP superfamily phosphohydrolase
VRITTIIRYTTGFIAIAFILIGLDANRFRVTQILLDTEAAPYLKQLDGYAFALVSDIHLKDTPTAWSKWENIIEAVNEQDPDYVFLLGDYTAEIYDQAELDAFQTRFLSSIATFEAPTISVLGNHETWNGRDSWIEAFEAANSTLLENETSTGKGAKKLCIIGIGDSYTGFAERPEKSCGNLPIVTVTHDPYAVIELNGTGLWFAGHTHCGQISLPLIRSIFAPTKAPKAFHCGKYQYENTTIYTSSGIGSSMIDLRFFANSQVELIRIKQ